MFYAAGSINPDTARDRAVESELAPDGCGPTSDAHPPQFRDIAVDQTLETAMNAERSGGESHRDT